MVKIAFYRETLTINQYCNPSMVSKSGKHYIFSP